MWIASLLATAAPLAQTERWQQLSINRAQQFLDRQRVLMAELYTTEHNFEESLHERKLALSRELHLNEVSHDIGIAQREQIRDDWSQHSLYLQSLMMMSSLMFSCVCAIFCEAGISLGSTSSSSSDSSSSKNLSTSNIITSSGDDRWDSGVSALIFSLLCAIGISSSLLSLWLGMKIQSRMAEYDFHAPTAIYKPCNKAHGLEFTDYHKCHLKEIERWSFVLFLIAVVCTVLSGCLSYCVSIAQSWDESSINNKNEKIIPSWIPIVISCFAVLVIVCGSLFGFRNARG